MKQPCFAINKTQDPAPVGRTLLNRKGNLLVYMVVVLLIFGVLGVSLVSLFSTTTGSTATPNDAKRARLIAESGIRYALSEIKNSSDIQLAAERLNTTPEFKLGKQGSFSASVFSTGMLSNETGSKTAGQILRLNVPYSGQFPSDFTVQDASIVDWVSFNGAPPPAGSFSAYTVSDQQDTYVDITIATLDDFDADQNATVCFAMLTTDADTRVEQGQSIYVAEEARDFYPQENGAIRILTLNNGKQYDYFYETLVHDQANNRVELTNLRELPGATWEDIVNLQASDYVILSPTNFRIFATGTSEETEITIGFNKPIWAIGQLSGYTIYMRELLADKEINQFGDVIRTQEAGDKKIELGKGTTGTEGFGDLWYGGDKAIGGDTNYCNSGACLFDKGFRVFFTTDVIPGANGGEGFTFSIIAGGTTASPVNNRNSVGGDFQLPELLAYGGASLKSDATFVDGSGEGLQPPKMALEFDTRTNFAIPLDYCTANNLNLIPGSRNDPLPGGELRDVLQYVYWGSDDETDLDLSCRSVAKESYDDNRHDAEGDQVALNFAFSVGAPIRSEPTYDPTDQTVYFTSDYNGTADVWAVNTDDGTLKWRYNAAGRDVTSKPALDTIGTERFVYFSAVDDLYKLKADPASPPAGESVWLRNVGGFLDKVSPVVDNNNHKIYIGSRETERFYAYASNGNQLWIKDLGEDIEATAAIDKTGGARDGNVYVGTADDNAEPDGRVYGFAPDALPPDPPPLWPYFITNNDVSSRPVLSQDGSVLYAVTDTGNVYAINVATGAQIWANTSDISGNTDFIDPAVWKTGASKDGTIYAANQDGDLYAFNPTNGIQKWQLSLTGSITFSSPAVGPDGTIYIGTDGNRVYAINPDSTTKWEFPIPGGFDVRSTPEVGDDGVVYVGANDGNLYALATVAMPRSYRNNWIGGQRGYLTSDDLGSTLSVDDPVNWLDGSSTLRGPWAIRMEVERDKNLDQYTLRTWIRQCAESDCSDIVGTAFQDTTKKWNWNVPWEPNLPFEQVIQLTADEDLKFERFLFGFTTAAGSSDDQLVEIRDFELTFSRPGIDESIDIDLDWPAP
jgi:outer membrane protein assembly factor BamB